MSFTKYMVGMILTAALLGGCLDEEDSASWTIAAWNITRLRIARTVLCMISDCCEAVACIIADLDATILRLEDQGQPQRCQERPASQ